ncbi:E3 ubiquitin-protein ligase HUWE1-like isoform X2 [Photinus pyralis]|uniref:E3 ubiquitin-protein ligase HUWE1-like isoform X2 n=1 Tax=Photinus pyralis TaxID=7054 RepID=UPI0012677EF7|nr:E3 ubiquitin-protein ligase HUWE1-like isoform X2 [Photinus pyralis]
MKIDRTRLRKGTSEIPAECHALIERLRQCSRSTLLEELSKISTWTFGKCELYHWIGVLDVFDSILEEATQSAPGLKWALNCDTCYDASDKKLLLWTLHFTTLLIEHSFSRHLYNSMEHLLTLMSSSDMNVVLAVLNLLYMFSKRSNFITRLANEKRQALLSRLHYLAESWGGKENGFGLAECCISHLPIPHSATTLHFEFHKDHSTDKENKELKETKLKKSSSYIHIENVDKLNKTPAEIMKGLVHLYFIPPDKEMWLFTHVRLAHHFAEYKTRLLCVQARLQALSVLVYSNALQDSAHTLLYNGFLEELVELIELDNPEMVDIRSAALRTLTSIIHLDRNPHFPKKSGSRLANIIDVTGANQYHGFLPTLVRHCIISLTRQTVVKSEPLALASTSEEDKSADLDMPQSGDIGSKFPLPLATALFSFLYHLASYEAGGEALVSCGMMESLLQVINWNGVELEHITFVTRAVRVIDLITNMDMQVFHNHGGLQSFINRLDVEVQLCRPEQIYEFKPIASIDLTISDVDEDFISNYECQSNTSNLGKTCLPQRAALLKSMLNFLKKALQDTMFSDNVRHVMEGILPSALKHIIANAEYYGPSLFLLATDLVTVYVFQEPTLLSTLQDNGLTDVILHALLIKDVPATREVLGSLPNVFSALCLNARGLQSFVKCKPFDRLFKVLVSPHYLSAMRRRRSSDPIGDTASNLGNAMDELMRHQPSLKADAIAAIVKLLHELCQLGTDSKYICWRPHSKSESSPVTVRTPINNEGSSDEEDDDEEEASTSSHNAQNESQESSTNGANEKTPIALVDYILNIMKFIDAILSNNSTDDHCREFVNQSGLQPLLKILGLPNLPVDCPVTISAQAVASVCKSILNLAHEPLVLKYGLVQLNDVLRRLKPLYSDLDTSSSSRLLHELAHAPHLETAFNNANATPLLHAMAAAHGYVLMFVHVCRTGQSEIRTLSLQHWGSEPGLAVLKNLAELYTSLVWESTLLLALCSDDAIPVDCDFGREDMERLNIPVFDRADCSYSVTDSTANVASALEGLSTNPTQIQTMDIDGEQITSKPTSQQLKYIKPLLGASSRLGRALAELFGLLVKLCVGTPVRQRRGQNIVSTPLFPTPNARAVATALNYLLANGLNSAKLPQSPVPKFKLTFLICSVGFTSPMLFDEKRYPYHLMLQKFVSLGGQTTFFNTFKWALSAGNTIKLSEGLEHPDLPEGTGEFLDAWLMLLEKMVNPKAILDTPHSLTTRTGSTSASARKLLAFSPLRYLIQIHKLAFEAIMFMWGKKPLPTYGVRMSESMLSILKHILRGEKIIKEKLAKGDDKPAASNGSRAESDVNQENLRQLMDMGFSRDHALEALIHTLNVEQATDYLLSNPSNRAGTSGMDTDFTEDDQVIQAIALSLGEPGPSVERKKEDIEEDTSPLSEDLINNFTKDALEICLQLIEAIPETVHKVCELLGTIMKRNGPTFRDDLLDKLLSTIRSSSMQIFHRYKYRPAVLEVHLELCESRESLCLGHLIHLFALFFEVPSFIDMRIPCGLAVHRAKLVPEFFNLLSLAERLMQHGAASAKEPKWLTPLLLLLDSLAKVGVCTHRKRNMHAVTNRVWRWYDVVTGKWTPYSTTNNKLINEAYWNGEQSIRVTCGRRRYTITFCNMLQCNDETGNSRPISMTPLCLEHEDMFTDCVESGDECATFEVVLSEKESKRCLPVPVLTDRLSSEIVQTIVRMLHYPIEKDLVHAIMRLCLRLTRNYDTAKTFANGGGIRALLKMRQTSSFNGYSSLATILIRHALEEPQTLAHSIEKVIRGRMMPSIPPPYRELIYLTRQIGSAVSRAPDTFYDVAKSILRVDCSIFRRPEDLDSRLPLKAEPTTRTHAPQMEEDSSITVIHDLLHALLKPLEWGAPENVAEVNSPKPSSSATTTREPMFQRASDLLGNSTASNEILNMEAQDDSSVAPIMLVHVTRNPGEAVMDTRPEQELVTRPMIAKHSILKILADAVVSYGAVAKLITDFTYKSGDGDIVTEDCSALAFMFDKLLPITENISDRECSMMCRVLIAAISSCNHCPEAQSTLVNEVKSALVRALLMPECFEKHSQIQLITGIITTMIENCPPSNQLRVFKNQPMNGQINNIVKLMLRKGIFNDLARISHYMDLSSPHFPLTVNSSLKPMESLSRIVNQPITGSNSNRMNKKAQQNNLDDTGATQSGTTSTEATNAQGEETIEDAENTEHDISAVASSLEANPEVSVAHGEADNVLEHIMDQLLERGNNDSNRTYTDVASGRNHHAMDIDDDGNLGFDHEPDATEELMSTDSGDSDSNASDQEVEDDDNDDDEDEGENIEITYEDDDDDVNNEVSNADREEDILMIQYADHELDEALPRMVRWNENGFAIPLFDDLNHTNEQTAPTSHPLLMSRHNSENGSAVTTRTQRTNRARRYQYLQLNPRNTNPPVILHRLLGPVAQNLSLSTNEIMGSPSSRDTARVVVMDNFGLIPTNEEQIDFVDPSGYLFGPSLAATLSHVPSVLHWWNEESKLLDPESHDIALYVSNKLIPLLITRRNKELIEHKKKKDEEEKSKSKAPEESENHESDVETIGPRSESTSTNDVEIIETNDPNELLERYERVEAESELSETLQDDASDSFSDYFRPSPNSELFDILSGGNAETNRSSTDQNLHLLALAASSNYDGQPFQENVGQPLNPSQNEQGSESITIPNSTNDFTYPFNEGSEEHPLDTLSEVERVASEGISGRHLQDMGNTNYQYGTEPFEEPSDLQFNPFVDMPSFPSTNEPQQPFSQPYPQPYPQQFSPRFPQFPTPALPQPLPQRFSRRRIPPMFPLPSSPQQVPPQLPQTLSQMLPPLQPLPPLPPPLQPLPPLPPPLQPLPPLPPPLPQTSQPYQRPLQRLSQRIAQIFPPLPQPIPQQLPQTLPPPSPQTISQPSSQPVTQPLNQPFPQRLQENYVFTPPTSSVSSRPPSIMAEPMNAGLFSSNTDANYSPHYGIINEFVPLTPEPVLQPAAHPPMLQNVTPRPVLCPYGVPVLDQIQHSSPVPLPNCYVGHEPLSPAGHIPCPMHALPPPGTHGQPQYMNPSVPPAHASGYQGPIPATFSTTHLPMFPPPLPVEQSLPENLSQIPHQLIDGTSGQHPTNQETIEATPTFQSFLELEDNRYTEGQNAPSSDVIQINSSTESSDDIPEGVDPSFLEALPLEMRREVLEQYRMLHSQHNRPSSSGTAVDETAGASSSSEVNPEFLAALPPALQEEVLTQQRLEQQRHAAAHANPDEPVDAGAFFETLQPSLRTMILSDMEDSQMSALPPDLAAEAQTLRRDWEARNRQIVQERIFQSNLTTIIRHSTRGRLSSRLNTHLLPQRAQWGTWGRAELFPPAPSANPGMRMRGRQLLDHESLSCLLVLIFANDPKLNTLRLHRVIRNLCYHSPTREWIIKALLSIIDKSVQCKPDDNSLRPMRRTPKPGPLTSKLITDLKNVGNGANWLNIRMEAALGCHANVFMVNRASGKRSDRVNGSSIVIHPQAGPIVCKNALDLFISLSKNFPSCLLPLRIREDKEEREERAKNMLVLSPSKYKIEGTDFWDMLLKLDSTSSKKGKSLAKTHSNFSLSNDVESICFGFEQSPFGQLLCMLSSPVIYRSTQLTDKLLRLLSVITAGMPELGKNSTSDTQQGKPKTPIYESVSAPESALSLAVNVLTYKSCSEEGLEDATTLLLNLANCSVDMRYVILKLLLSGALRIGEVVREQIQCMLRELRNLNKVQKRKTLEEASPSSSKGMMQNRFTKETVIITASTKVKAGYDLQLPCMAPLTSKTSSQLFFLRVLRVIVQIREAIKNGLLKEEEEKKKNEEKEVDKPRDDLLQDTSDVNLDHSHLSALSDQLFELESLWDTLSLCLLELEHTPDDHAVLVLQPAVEAFFLVYSPQQGATDREVSKPQNSAPEPESSSRNNESGSESSDTVTSVESSAKLNVPVDQLKFINFAEKHRTVLNQILRQTTAHLTDGPFSVLVDHTKVLDFDVKRKYFRTELERLDQGLRREETAIHVRRSHVFEDSFRELYRRTPEEWKNRFYIVFEEEEGQDAGGLLREWYMIISRDIFNPMYALFTTSPGDRVTYMINPASHYNPNHLCYFKFVGRVIAKAIYDNKLLECYFTRSFYKHILGIPVKYTDMESEDYSFYRGLVYLMEYHVKDLDYDLTFSTEINEFGVTETRDLIPDGRNVPVTEENKMEYVRLSCQMKMTGAIRQQLNAFLEGFYDIIPKRLISIFNEQELELLISGLPNVDIDDLKANTEYHKYQSNSLQIQWFWRALRSFDQADRAKFLQFVTGTSKVPLQGFAHLEGMNGVQKFQVHRDDRSTDRLPSAHTCFNQLDLPVYETSEKLRTYLQKAIHECSEGFGFA